jgi:hypothetical protein
MFCILSAHPLLEYLDARAAPHLPVAAAEK